MAYASLQKPIEDIIECPICTETLKNTRVLPCIHTFCLQCIKKFGKDKKPGDAVRCPCCRSEFHVPIGGFAKLPKNTFIEKLLEVQCAVTTERGNSSRICTMPGHGKNCTNQSFAIWHCVECKQQMCGGCRSVHLRQGGTSFHRVLPVQKENPCQEHPDKQLDRFCKTCRTPVCGECCASNHKGHDWNTLVNYVTTLQKEIDKLRLRNIQQSVQDRALPLSLDANHKGVGSPYNLPVIAFQVAPNVDRFESLLREEHNKMHKLAVERDRFESLIREEHNKMRKLAVELERFESLMHEEQNKIPKLAVVEDRIKSRVCLHQDEEHNKGGMEGLLVFVVILLLAFCWQSRAWMNEERASWSSEKYNYTLSEETLKRQIQNLTVKQKENLLLIRRMEKYIDTVQYAYHPALTNTFELESAENRALALIDGKLLIANSINGDLKVLDAHSLTNETDWATIPSSTVAGMGLCRKNGQVFVSTWNKSIFRFNRNGQLLSKWPVKTVASGVISVTDDCNVVLAVRDNSKKILIYSTHGKIISEVEMKEDILESRLIKAVQISKGRFLVSYGEGDDPVHGIAIVNSNGQTIKSYGRRYDAGIGQLRDPRDFVVDGLGNVLVADSGNGRILLLDSELNFQRELVSMEHGLQHPFGILLNEFANLLYVADNQWDPTKKEWTNGRIMVFKIK